MALHTIQKGLDLPIAGAALQVIRGTRVPDRVAVMADDFPGMKPRMRVREGDRVKRGQVLFEDSKIPGVFHTAPGAGQIVGIHRGAKRALQSVVIDLTDSERRGTPTEDDFQCFESHRGMDPGSLSRDAIRDILVESGQWTALRTRPFSKVPEPTSTPNSIFVTAIDTNPLAPLPDVVIERRREDFDRGLAAIEKLTDGPTHLCVHATSEIPEHVQAPVEVQRFTGPHPAGDAGLHIHLIDPVGRNKTVWTIGYQDVIAVGSLLASGRLDVGRVIALVGPAIPEPQLVESRLGANVDDLVGDLPTCDEVRRIAGSVLSGKAASGDVFGFLGRYHNQITVLEEGRQRVFMGWLTPGLDAFSTLPIYLSRLLPKKRFRFTTTTNGSPRAMVPIGMYERIMPMDILPTFLLRALVVGDIEQAEKLGILELDEEDLSLCSFVCPGKTDYGPLLRKNLAMIEKEG